MNIQDYYDFIHITIVGEPKYFQDAIKRQVIKSEKSHVSKNEFFETISSILVDIIKQMEVVYGFNFVHGEVYVPKEETFLKISGDSEMGFTLATLRQFIKAVLSLEKLLLGNGSKENINEKRTAKEILRDAHIEKGEILTKEEIRKLTIEHGTLGSFHSWCNKYLYSKDGKLQWYKIFDNEIKMIKYNSGTDT